LSFCWSNYEFYQFVTPPIKCCHLSIYPSVQPRIYLFIHLSIHPSGTFIHYVIHPSIHTYELYNLSAKQKSLLQLLTTYTSSPRAALTFQESVLTYPKLVQIIPNDYWSFIKRRQAFSKLSVFQLFLTIWRLNYVNVFFFVNSPRYPKEISQTSTACPSEKVI
jgi:hypothetical protein